MDKKKPKDNLEDLFGKMFNDSEKVNQRAGWNVPSESVWTQVQAELTEEKEPERKFLYWRWLAIAASMLLFISIIQLYHYNEKIKVLSSQLQINEQAVKDIQSNLQAINDYQQQQPTIAKANTTISPKKNSPLANKQAIITKTTQNKTVFNKINADITESKQSSFLAPPLSNESLDEVPAKITQANNINLEEKEIKKIPISIKEVNLLSRTINELNIHDRKIIPSLFPITSVLKTKSNFYIAAEYAPIKTSSKSKGFQFGRPDFLPKRESQQKSYTAGLRFGMNLGSSWAIETGLSYTVSKNTVRHNRSIPFKLLVEQLNTNGTYESTYNFQLGSSGGTVETDVVLSRSTASTVEENTNLNFDITSSTTLTYLDIPLVIKRKWTIGKFGLNFRTGLMNRFLVNKSFDLENVASNDARFQTQSNNYKTRPNYTKSTTYTPHLVLGVGLDYKLNQQLSLYIEPTFTKSIEPLMDFASARIHSESKMLNVGIRYSL